VRVLLALVLLGITGPTSLSIVNASYANVSVWEYSGCRHRNPVALDLPKHSAIIVKPRESCDRLGTAFIVENGGFSPEWCEFRYHGGFIKKDFYGGDTHCSSNFGEFIYNL
jgi:hypothetical protein